MTTQVFWCGEVHDCQLCEQSLGRVMYDAKTVYGPWANVCQSCFAGYGVGIGLGRGQKYEKQPDNRWLKTAG